MQKIRSLEIKTAEIACIAPDCLSVPSPLLKCLGPFSVAALFSKRFVNESGVNVSHVNNFSMIMGGWVRNQADRW